jgi:fucose permease
LDARFAAGKTALAAGLFVLPEIVALVLEPPIMASSDRHRAKRQLYVAGGLFFMGLGLILGALAGSIWLFSAAFAAYAVGGGVALGAAKAILVDSEPDPEKVLTRWTFLAEIGDILAPLGLLLVSVTVALEAAGALLLLVALATAMWGSSPATHHDDEEDDEPLWASAKTAVKHPGLLAWLFATSLCLFLDELFVVYGGLFFTERFPGAPVAVLWTACSIGAFVGLALASRLGIGACAAITALSLAALLVAPSFWLAMILVAVVGLGAAPLYPLCLSQAHRSLPGRPGMVAALGALFVPLDLVAPLVMGAIADHVGTGAALAVTLLQPVGILVVWLRARR